MHYILVLGSVVLNCDNSEDRDRLVANGFKCLETEEIHAAGMQGYEHLVSPLNTTVGEDGSISFTLSPLTIEQMFSSLRTARDVRLVSTNWLVERHRDEQEAGKATTLTTEQYAALLAYRQALRDLPAQTGAPWDGGGTSTPWPVMSVEL